MSISYAFVLDIMQKHILYVQSFTLIKSTGARISTGTGGIPSPTVQNIHSLTGIFIDICLWYILEVHDLHNATTFGSHRLQ
jgi:hypothetical protein